MSTQDVNNNARTIFICCVATIAIGFGIRQGFGLFMRPITLDMGWTRETLAATFATQALVLGLMAPLTGMLADRWSPGKVIMLGGALFTAGLVTMGFAQSPMQMWAGGALLAGAGLSAVGMPLILAVIGRIAPENKRGLWLGIATSAGTIGQIVLIPLSQYLIEQFDWRTALFGLACMAVFTVPLARAIANSPHSGLSNRDDQSISHALNEARSHRGYVLLLIGFFVCGFHVQFIAIHLPAYIADQGLSTTVAATALIIIALGNACGASLSGWLGDRFRKRDLLSAIYAGRAVLFAIFVAMPVSETSVFIFSCVLGFLWLSTVPLTSSIVAQIFGPRYMATLFAFVFMSHQLGSFAGVWVGGYMFDATGSYRSVWLLTSALGVGASLLHIFVDDQPLVRVALATRRAQQA
jgi:predicted MFS family arabinose efflux permease